ncbi:LTA synthase family protein [Bacillus bombysepticus]|uniref:LTA synthase family protein n=1 Tax=Bacillus bombysepticus TaxID=658666 RepID=UPI003019A1EB
MSVSIEKDNNELDSKKTNSQKRNWFWRISKHISLIFVFAVVSLWVKNYIAFRFEFDLGVENKIQEFILFLTPISSVLLVMMWVWLMKTKWQNRYLLVSHFVLTVILYSNLVFYRFFNDFITIPVLFQTKNFGDLGGSAIGLMRGTDILYFVDCLILLYLVKFKKKNTLIERSPQWKKQMFKVVMLVTVATGSLNLILAESQRPQLLTRTFDRQILVRLLGLYNFQVYDMVMYTKSATQRVLANDEDLVEVEKYVQKRQLEPNPSLYGIAKGKNVVVISLESTQNFLVNYRLHDQEVTPFLNSLTKQSLYFDNFYHQTGQGKTSDAEFLVENSFFGLPRGSAFSTRADNTYRGMAKIIGEQGYHTAVFHGNNASFWNRDKIYPRLGIQTYFDESYYKFEDGEAIGYGLKDIPFFDQSVDLMKGMKKPFYGRMITLTNHYPYDMDEEDMLNSPHETGDVTVDNYFQTARYQDAALEKFFQKMKDTGLYDDTIFVLYGDHYGISENHNKAMEVVMGQEITPLENVYLQKVPFIIHIPGVAGQTIHSLGGQLDIKPTVLHLLGIETKNEFMLGQDLFGQERNKFVPLRDGSVIGESNVYTKEKCYDIVTKTRVDQEICKPLKEQTEEILDLSDKVLYGDLLRFRTKIQLGS